MSREEITKLYAERGYNAFPEFDRANVTAITVANVLGKGVAENYANWCFYKVN